MQTQQVNSLPTQEQEILEDTPRFGFGRGLLLALLISGCLWVVLYLLVVEALKH